MEKEEIEKLIDLRQLMIEHYAKLNGGANPGTAVMLQRDVARLIEVSIRKIDGMLKNYVEIKKEQ